MAGWLRPHGISSKLTGLGWAISSNTFCIFHFVPEIRSGVDLPFPIPLALSLEQLENSCWYPEAGA